MEYSETLTPPPQNFLFLSQNRSGLTASNVCNEITWLGFDTKSVCLCKIALVYFNGSSRLHFTVSRWGESECCTVAATGRVCSGEPQLGWPPPLPRDRLQPGEPQPGVRPGTAPRCAALCCTVRQVSGSRWLWQLQTRRSDTGRPRQVLVVALPPPAHQAAPVDLDLLDCLQQVIYSPEHCALLVKNNICGDILLDQCKPGRFAGGGGGGVPRPAPPAALHRRPAAEGGAGGGEVRGRHGGQQGRGGRHLLGLQRLAQVTLTHPHTSHCTTTEGVCLTHG